MSDEISSVGNVASTKAALKVYVALCAGFTLGYLSFFFLPLLTPILVSGYGIDSSLVGWIVGAEVGALTLSTVLLSRHVASANWFSVSLRGVLVFVASNIAMLITDGFAVVALMRALSGIGEGAILVCAFAAAGHTPHPEKSFGLMSIAAGLFSAAGLVLVPGWLEAIGERNIFFIFAAVGGGSIPLLIGLKSLQTDQADGATAASPIFAPGFLVALYGGLFLLALTGFGIWPFLDFQAANLAIADDLRSSLYAVTTLMNMVGSLFPVVVGMRLGMRAPVIGASLLCTVCLVSIGIAQSDLLFLMGSALLLFSVALALPYLMAFCSVRDSSGELVARMPAVLGVGQAAGPVLAGALLVYGFPMLGWVFGGLCLLATAMFVMTVSNR